ncbi:MAG: FAD-dependent oxidoreductase [Planctomycetota bacterium]
MIAPHDTHQLIRSIPVERGYDLVVLGGGPAGMAAAISAGRLGAKVLLVEATGCMGGMGTSGLVTAFDPMANGEEMLVGGLMREIVWTLYRRGELGPHEHPDRFAKAYMRWTPFRVEGYKRLLDELAIDAGVEIRFFTKLIDAEHEDNRVTGVVLHNIEGYRYVEAKTFVDATGDAVLADLVGVDCREAGRDTPNIMPASLPSLFTGMDHVTRPRNREDEQAGLKQALADGHFTQPDRHLPGLSEVGRFFGYLNGGHLFNLNALRCDSMSQGVMLGRKIAKEYLEFYRKYIPGFEDVEHVTTASLIGVRESRRIVGEYELNVDDYMGRRHFPDQIGLFNKFIDVHPYDTSDEQWARFLAEKNDRGNMPGPGESFGIPYGVLVPKGWHNLWVAGRCASADVQVQGVIRVQPAAAMMGQAAGTAAVQSARTERVASEIDTAELIQTLRAADANLSQEELSDTMTLDSALTPALTGDHGVYATCR